MTGSLLACSLVRMVPMTDRALASGDEILLHFSRQAMATTFAITLCHPDPAYAGQAAWAVFQLLEEIEAELSRFDPNSDIARLNLLPPGERLLLGAHAFACLWQARAAWSATREAFDVTAGILKDEWLRQGGISARLKAWYAARRVRVGMELLHLDEKTLTVRKEAPVAVDLGAIGKGYAVDRMVERLAEWGIDHFVLHGGRSSVAARGRRPGHDGWPVHLRHPQQAGKLLTRFDLQQQALGASGLEKGRHIIDPRTKKPARDALAAWVVAPEAATADAFSTACMILSTREMAVCFADQPEIGCLLLPGGGIEPVHFNWPYA